MGTGQARVSIGVPVFNGERYLAEALDSILSQTYSQFELIICDNASVDGTRAICEQYAQRDHRVKYYRNDRNLGLAPNYNRAFELSSGEYFKWAAYDDVLAPEFLQRCVETLDRKPEIVCCCPKVRLIDGSGGVVEDYDPVPDVSSPKAHVRFGELILNHDHWLAQVYGLMRAEFVRQTVLHGSYPCSDEVFLANLGLLGRFAETEERLLLLRLHDAQSFRGILASERARVLFFNSSLRGKAVPIKWLYLRMCLVAINRAPIGALERSICYWCIVRWLGRKQNLRSVSKDILLMVHELVPVFPKLRRDVVAAAESGRDYR